MLKKILLICSIIFLVFLFCITVFHKDTIEEEKTVNNTSQDTIQNKSTTPYKIVEIDGAEFLESRGEVGKFGGSISDSTIGEGPKTFNCWNAKDATSSSLGGLMFESLVTTDPFSGEVIPRLAKSFEVDETGKIYTIKLRKGLKWSDGKPLTAQDVDFTYNTIIKKGYGDTSIKDVMNINGVMPECKVIDDYTIIFTTPEPFAPFLRMLSFAIAPKHILKPVTDKGIEEFNSFWGTTTNPKDFVVSGAFKLKEYVPAQRVVFERNPNFMMVDKNKNRLPYLDNYVVYIVGDLNNQVLKFEAKELDILPVKGNQVARFKMLEKNSDYKMYNLGPTTSSTFLFFNLNTRKDKNGKYYVDPIKQKWFNDTNFRKAIDYAIDRESIVANILSSVGSPLFSAESLTSIFLNEKISKGHPKDIKYAEELLKKSGFYKDEKGILHDKNGNVVEFNLLTNAGNIERESVGVMIKEDLQDLGIKVNFKPIEFNVLVGKLGDSLDYEAAIMGLTGSGLEPNNGANVWYSYGTLHLFNIRKPDEYNNVKDITPWEKRIDEIFAKGATVIDFETRKKYYDEYQQIVYDENPFIYLYSPLNIYAVRNKFGNINPTPIGGVSYNLEEIYLK